MTDSAGNLVAQYSYNSDGRVTKLQGSTVESDFAYAGMYAHRPSGLSLAVHRAYSPTSGRWISRDPVGDLVSGPILGSSLKVNRLPFLPTESFSGPNLYNYVANRPVMWRDPSGLLPQMPGFCPTLNCQDHPVLCECIDNCSTPEQLKPYLGSFQLCFYSCIKNKEPAQGPYVPRPPKMDWPFNPWQQQVPPEEGTM